MKVVEKAKTHKWPCRFRANTCTYNKFFLNLQFLSSFASPFTEKKLQVQQRLCWKKGTVHLKLCAPVRHQGICAQLTFNHNDIEGHLHETYETYGLEGG